MKCRVRNAGPTPLTAPLLSRSARNLLVTPSSRHTRGKGRRSPTASGLLSGACSEARKLGILALVLFPGLYLVSAGGEPGPCLRCEASLLDAHLRARRFVDLLGLYRLDRV